MATTQSSSPSDSFQNTQETPLFSEAGATWFGEHKNKVRPSTADCYADALRSLNKLFGKKPINEIALVHVRMYQQLRNSEVSAHAVNRELGVLQQVLKRFDSWSHLQGKYKQLKEPPSRPREAPVGVGPSDFKSERTGNLVSFPVRVGVSHEPTPFNPDV